MCDEMNYPLEFHCPTGPQVVTLIYLLINTETQLR